MDTVSLNGKEYPLKKFKLKTYGLAMDCLPVLSNEKVTFTEKCEAMSRVLVGVLGIPQAEVEEADPKEAMQAVAALMEFNTPPSPKAMPPRAAATTSALPPVVSDLQPV